MRERKLEIVFLGVRTIISIILITMISFVIMSLVKDIPGRELKYGAAMPVFSRIIINGDTLNYMNIAELITLEVLVFKAPVLGYILTGDEIKSAPGFILSLITPESGIITSARIFANTRSYFSSPQACLKSTSVMISPAFTSY